MWELDYKESWVPKNWCFRTVVLEKTLQSPLDCKEIKPSILKEISPEYSLEGLMLKLNSNTLATWCQELTHWKRPWCWERLKVGGERDDRGWGSWMASPTQWTWVWVSSGSWWWTGKPGVLQSMGSQQVRHDWATELNWEQRFPTSGIYCLMICGRANVIIIEIQYTINRSNRNKAHYKCKGLNETIHSTSYPTPTPQACRKIIFHKTGPWCQKVWGL